MRCFLTALIICLTTAPPAGAGAWMRDRKTGFLSVTTTLRNVAGPLRYETSIYADYGLAPRLSLGLDVNERPGTAGHVLLFARLPLRDITGKTRLAVELGLGGYHWRGRWGNMAKANLSLGHSFDSHWGAGWLAVDAAVELRQRTPGPIYKLDATIGLTPTRRFAPILQLETTHTANAPFAWALTPGVMIKGRRNLTWLAGIEVKSALQTSLGLKLGLWRKF